MALEGTLRDFSIADILQLIALQKKTGLLTLRSPDDNVTLGFVDGRLVSAESSAKRLDTRLGTLLVRTHRLRPESLQKALEIQSQTLQRLGFILLKNGFCSAEDLREGLDTQVRKITYGLFRWTDGEYSFEALDRIDYDHEFVTPVAVEGLLMEGARMMDEWPIISKVVRSSDIVYRRHPVAQAVEPADTEEGAEEVGETTLLRKTKERKGHAIKISRAEWTVYELVDGQRSVAEIVERTFLSEFEGAKAFYDLVSRGLVDEVPRADAEVAPEARSAEFQVRRPSGSPFLVGALVAVLVALVPASLLVMPRNPLNVLTVPSRPFPVRDSYLKAISLVRLRCLAEAVDTYFLTSGKLPDTLDALVVASLTSTSATLDPWGRKYRYILQQEKYYLVGFDRSGKTDTDLFVSYTVRGAADSAKPAVRSKAGKEIIVLE